MALFETILKGFIKEESGIPTKAKENINTAIHFFHTFDYYKETLGIRRGKLVLNEESLSLASITDGVVSFEMTLYTQDVLSEKTTGLSDIGNDLFGYPLTIQTPSVKSTEPFLTLSNWIVLDDDCAVRIKLGGQVETISDRVAFIEKTPRVRAKKDQYSVELDHELGGAKGMEQDAWISAAHLRSSDYGYSEVGRHWCDQMLSLLGHE